MNTAQLLPAIRDLFSLGYVADLAADAEIAAAVTVARRDLSGEAA